MDLKAVGMLRQTTPNHELEPLGLGVSGENYPARTLQFGSKGPSPYVPPPAGWHSALAPARRVWGAPTPLAQVPQMNQSEQPEINISVAQMCTLLGVSRLTLDRAWDRGEGPPVFLLGKRKFTTPSLLKSWLAERQRGATSNPHTTAA